MHSEVQGAPDLYGADVQVIASGNSYTDMNQKHKVKVHDAERGQCEYYYYYYYYLRLN